MTRRAQKAVSRRATESGSGAAERATPTRAGKDYRIVGTGEHVRELQIRYMGLREQEDEVKRLGRQYGRAQATLGWMQEALAAFALRHYGVDLIEQPWDFVPPAPGAPAFFLRSGAPVPGHLQPRPEPAPAATPPPASEQERPA